MGQPLRANAPLGATSESQQGPPSAVEYGERALLSKAMERSLDEAGRDMARDDREENGSGRGASAVKTTGQELLRLLFKQRQQKRVGRALSEFQ